MNGSVFSPELDISVVGANRKGPKSKATSNDISSKSRTSFDDTLDEIVKKIRDEIAMPELKRRAPWSMDAPTMKRFNTRQAILNLHSSELLLPSKDRPLSLCKVEQPTPPPTPADFIDNRRFKFSFAVLPPSVPRCDPIKICRPLNPTHSNPLYSTASIRQDVRSSNAMTRSVSSILPFNPDPFCRQIQNVVQNAVPSFPDRKSSFKDNAANLTTTIERCAVAEFFNGKNDTEDEFVQVD
ncbi:hypothetical protein PRIPAC_90226 [Pristionchus pacificus]|uniref:Uncharacterized protein n=1 Tax=Pristionchus pacificus TaxID=54126 RepID=A0A2A6BYT5_PRIPA|nr:hypothetical protein PRIPAC_90226 [Pristionchus pacificus]|eukprot:PDM71162.1 hypothetical protein PRIPAC_43545 [Pristionchus pacificus]